MCAEDLSYISPRRTHLYPRTCNALPHIPVPPIEGCWSSIERVRDHVALYNGPSGQDSKSSTKYAAVVEFPIWQEVAGLLANGIVVHLCPAFLKTDNVWLRISGGDLVPNLSQTLVPESSNVFEAPAVEREYP